MNKNKYFYIEPLAKNIVFVDGISRTGKLMTGAILSSFNRMESIESGGTFEHFLPALKLKKCSFDFAKSYLCNYINQLIYNKMISRNVNFRATDRTGIPNYFNPKIYKKRLKMKEGDIVLERIKKSKPILPFITHDIMVNYSIFSKLKLNVKFIQIFRNPIDLAYSWYKRGLGNRFGNDPRIFTLLLKKNKKPYPWYLYNFSKKFIHMNNVERSIYYVILLTKKSIKEYRKIDNKKKIYLTTYEKIVENTNKEILSLSKYLNTSFSKKTFNFIRKERLPKRIKEGERASKLRFIKNKVSPKIFKELVSFSKKYNKNLYGLI